MAGPELSIFESYIPDFQFLIFKKIWFDQGTFIMQNRRNNKCVFLRSFLQSLRFCLIRIFVKVYLGWVHSFISHSPIPDQSDTVHIKPQPGALLQLQTTFHRERYTRYKLTCLDTRRCLESRPSWTDVILSYSMLGMI